MHIPRLIKDIARLIKDNSRCTKLTTKGSQISHVIFWLAIILLIIMDTLPSFTNNIILNYHVIHQ